MIVLLLSSPLSSESIFNRIDISYYITYVIRYYILYYQLIYSLAETRGPTSALSYAWPVCSYTNTLHPLPIYRIYRLTKYTLLVVNPGVRGILILASI